MPQQQGSHSESSCVHTRPGHAVAIHVSPPPQPVGRASAAHVQHNTTIAALCCCWTLWRSFAVLAAAGARGHDVFCMCAVHDLRRDCDSSASSWGIRLWPTGPMPRVPTPLRPARAASDTRRLRMKLQPLIRSRRRR